MKSEDLAGELRQRIEAGRLPPADRPDDALPPGSVLPTVDELAASKGTDRNTAHRAHQQLKAAGLIHTRPGRRAVVADSSPLYVITTDAYAKAAASDGLTAWELQVAEIGEDGRTEHYQGQLRPSTNLGLDSRNASIAELFGLLDEAQYVHLAGDGWATPVGPTGDPDPRLERVVQIYDGWFDPELADVPGILEPRDAVPARRGRLWVGGAYGLIERATGRVPVPRRRIITERPSTKAEEVRFRVPPLTPISAEVEVSADQHGRVLSVVWYRRLFGVAQWDLA